MTYIEFFDSVSTENISSCLAYVPDKVIYLGDSTKKMASRIKCYKKFFKSRGYNIEVIAKSASKSDLSNAVSVITDIVETNDECVFDITGGDEMLILALGMVYTKFPDKNIQIHKFNINKNKVYDCDFDGNTINNKNLSLTVDENIQIHGGDVLYGNVDENHTYKWELTTDFLNDFNHIWSICKTEPGSWNSFIGLLDVAEKVGKVSENGLSTEANQTAIKMELSNNGAKYKVFGKMLRDLIKFGLIESFDDSNGSSLKVTYKNKQIKRCLTKAGQALELKVFLSAGSLKDEKNNPLYNDVVNGVLIDWNGEFHDEEKEGIYDTENEIDVVLMHDVIPVFISCKNGIVTADELYKLNTVAERFGGKYAKRVLVANAICKMKKSSQMYLRQRIEDMGIILIENIHLMSDEELKKELAKICCDN